MQPIEPQSFVFAPPVASHVIWTERRTFDTWVTGAPVAEHDTSDLRWDVSTHRSLGDTTVVDERPMHVTASEAGRRIVDGVPALADMQLVIDDGGNLEDLRGLDDTSSALCSLASPAEQQRAARLLSPGALRTIAVTRHALFLGDVVGRPGQPGATWIVPRRPGGFALVRRYVVEGPRQCGDGVCASLHIHVDLDPRIMRHAVIVALQRNKDLPADVSAMEVTAATYTMDGEILVDPRTLMTFGATLDDAGRAIVALPSRKYEVNVRGRTEDTFEYGARRISTAPLRVTRDGWAG